MINLKFYNLDFDKTLIYIKDNLAGTNTLSSSILKYVQFASGTFFTILPDDIGTENLYKFETGGFSHGVRDEARSIVFNRLINSLGSCCVFDNASETYIPEYKGKLFLKHGFYFNDEIYYFISSRSATKEIMEKCFYSSNAIWHSLCLLTEFECDIKIAKEVTIEKIKDICLGTQLILIGAYDEEGYIFWEKLK